MIARNAVGRLIAFALLALLPASAAEAVVGAVRDGAVHHESSTAATLHTDSGSPSHGHEDHAPGHQHGTLADHCTHAHSIAPIEHGLRLKFGGPIHTSSEPSPSLYRRTLPLEEFHPPRITA